jgi:hypothetical protein
MMIMGIPNVGKSTLMNALLKRKIAAVGDEPAVTKSQQSVVLSPRLTLVDTPGIMWPKIEHDSDGYMLAASHAIGRNAVLEEEVATFLAGILLARYPGPAGGALQVFRARPGRARPCWKRPLPGKPGLPAQGPGRGTRPGKGSHAVADRLPGWRARAGQPGDAQIPAKPCWLWPVPPEFSRNPSGNQA